MLLIRSRTVCLVLALSWTLNAGATPTSAAPPVNPHPVGGPKLPTSQLVDVNSAPRDVLVKLPGVTPALADQIIAHRPYLSKAKLVTRKVMPLATFQMIRGLIMTMPPAQK